MSQIRASENIERFQAWVGSMSDADFKQIVHRGQLKRSEVATGCGFAKSVLQQNPEIKRILAELEDALRERGVLPPKTPEKADADSKPKRYDAETNARNIDKNRLRKLEQENLELKAKLARFEELSEVLTEMGVKF